MEKGRKSSSDKEIEVAKLNFRQSVLIALISASSGIIVTYLTVSSKFPAVQAEVAENTTSPSDSKEYVEPLYNTKNHLYYLRISSASLTSKDVEFSGIRIHGYIEGAPVSYPMKSVWAKLPVGKVGNYPLILKEKRGFMSFTMIAQDKNGVLYEFTDEMRNVSLTYDVSKTPYEVDFNLNLDLLSPHNIKAEAKVSIEIRKEPFEYIN
ncbi:hypothetical protein [Dyadobacter bucti]|uniref:hypothetical protein n=1 Tax=Dyadobacter bucti TaxID=2572203 RepID=UPI001108E6AB|nr:hypothetical protein [Dyadobacter bucti]